MSRIIIVWLINLSAYAAIIYNWLWCNPEGSKINICLSNYIIAYTILETIIFIAGIFYLFIVEDMVDKNSKILLDYNKNYNNKLDIAHQIFSYPMVPIIAINGYFFLLVVFIFNLFLIHATHNKMKQLTYKMKNPDLILDQ